MEIKRRTWYFLAGGLLLLVICAGIGGWIWSTNQPSQPQPTPQVRSTPTVPAPVTLNMGSGATLEIPAIKVSAPIELVSTDAQGRMDIPHKKPWDGVAWYKEGPIPGQQGSAVIDGHLDRPGGLPAVFWDLHKLHVGDDVMVKDAQGHVLHFRVYKAEMYSPDQAPADKIFGDTSGTYLNLITCAGEWVPSLQQTTKRLVVYTKLV